MIHATNFVLKEGMPAPDFTLMGSDNIKHTLSHYLGKKIVLYFYPHDHTPGCTKEAESFRDHHSSFKKLNAIVIGINCDSISSHKDFIKNTSLPFILLSDTDKTVCKLYNVLKEKNIYGEKRIDVDRSTFIIDEHGTIIKIYRKVRIAKHVPDILIFIDKNNK